MTIRNAKNAFKKVTSFSLPDFYHCTMKNKDIALHFRIRAVYMQFNDILPFWIPTFQFFDLVGIHFRKIKFLILGAQI